MSTGVFFYSGKIYTARRSRTFRLLVFALDGNFIAEESFDLSSLQDTVAGIAIAHDHIFVAAVELNSTIDKTGLTTHETTIYAYTLSGAETEEAAIIVPNFDAGGLTSFGNYLYLLGTAYSGPVDIFAGAVGSPIVKPISI